MSETSSTTTNEQIVVHSGGHLKRISTAGLENGAYTFKLQDGAISLTAAANTTVNPKMLKGSDDKAPLAAAGCNVPVATTNGTKWDKLTLPTDQNDCKAILYKGTDGWGTTSITGGNLLTNLMGLTKPTSADNCYQVYWNAKDSKWKLTNAMSAGMNMLMKDSNGISYVKLNGANFFNYCCNVENTENVILQYNKGTVQKITVPTEVGTYSLSVGQTGDVAFSTSTVGSRAHYNFVLAPKSGATQRPSILSGSYCFTGSGDTVVSADNEWKFKLHANYLIDARFYCSVADTAVFDNQQAPSKISLKIGSNQTSDTICETYLFHPESNMIEFHFTGMLINLTKESPELWITTDSTIESIEFKFPVDLIGRISMVEI